ncbi:hypothetical protein AXG93_441s1030 [Marchantia polymorpha subsp. ruderalis]|uniref:FAD-binding FR-type domain-containing protein n=1 Tax=Marchantia polymorpha subsp. ruderalis TaxID=1480154 RepID=A0A176W3X7_MARPO|nr:hypothetical protein AXG93_441s1030 [Marchantia polymorpha subsp. ruderalis]
MAFVAKTAVLILLWGLFLFWTIEWLIFPTEPGMEYKAGAIKDTQSDFLDLNGPYYLMYTLPVFLFAILTLVYLELLRKYPEREQRTSELPKWSRFWAKISNAMWTQPILVGTPMGILTAADLALIAVVGFGFLWLFCNQLLPALDLVDHTEMKNGRERWMIKVGRVGTWTGRAWYLPMALLFFPISRASPILRLLNIPFEHAVRYHRWLGHLSLWVLLTHSITFSLHIYYTGGEVADGIFTWPRFGVSNLAGVISMIAGIFLWVTSLEVVRKRFFDVFYVTHHMYLLVFAFAAWHVGEFASFYFLGCVMLYFIDRFLRMIQSRDAVSVLSAQVLPSGVVKLKFPKSPSLTYKALGMIYINVPSVSRFEWHPFSTTSSSLENSNDMSICIKPLGGWTRSLLDSLTESEPSKNKSGGCPLPLKLFAEGPYGPERDYFLRYKTLVLVAGGVGITPYMAIIRDLLCRYRMGQEGIPENVELIWCVPRRADLATLKDVAPTQMYPEFGNSKLNIVIRTFVTREGGDGKDEGKAAGLAVGVPVGSEEVLFTAADQQPRREVAHIGQSNVWVAAVIAAATTGFIIVYGIFHIAVVRPNNHSSAPFFFEHGSSHASDGPQGKAFSTAAAVTILFLCMLLGVVVFGGAVVLMWMWSKRSLSKTDAAFMPSPDQVARPGAADLEGNQTSLLDHATIVEGPRPNIADLFEGISGKYPGEDLGVMVSGPESLQDSVAEACRNRNFKYCNTRFQFYSISFDL